MRQREVESSKSACHQFDAEALRPGTYGTPLDPGTTRIAIRIIGP